MARGDTVEFAVAGSAGVRLPKPAVTESELDGPAAQCAAVASAFRRAAGGDARVVTAAGPIAPEPGAAAEWGRAADSAEKGIAWLRLTAKGTAGHGSMINNDNAVTALAAAVARLGQHEWPVQLVPSVRQFLEEASAAIGIPLNPDDPWSLLGKLGPAARMIGATLKHTVNPTGLKAGYKVNVIPQTATAEVDCRFLPGLEHEFFAEMDRLLGGKVTREFIHHDIALETTADGDLYDAMTTSLLAEDPDAKIVPYCLSAGTDAKWFSKLGIRCFGFSPLQLPPDLDFSGMFHGIDERVPVSGLRFGVRVFDRFLDAC